MEFLGLLVVMPCFPGHLALEMEAAWVSYVPVWRLFFHRCSTDYQLWEPEEVNYCGTQVSGSPSVKWTQQEAPAPPRFLRGLVSVYVCCLTWCHTWNHWSLLYPLRSSTGLSTFKMGFACPEWRDRGRLNPIKCEEMGGDEPALLKTRSWENNTYLQSTSNPIITVNIRCSSQPPGPQREGLMGAPFKCQPAD